MNNGVKILKRKKINCDDLMGKYLDESNYDILVESDYDCYGYSGLYSDVSEKSCIFKFRKGFFSEEEQLLALEGLREAATSTDNRGLAAGLMENSTKSKRKIVLDYEYEILQYLKSKKMNQGFKFDNIKHLVEESKVLSKRRKNSEKCWCITKVPSDFNFIDWAYKTDLLPDKDRREEAKKVENWIDKTFRGKEVFSGIVGWFGRVPRFPYGRVCSYTERSYEKFEKSFPLLRKLSKAFSELLPERFEKQTNFLSNVDEKFYVPGTPFTTITVNRSFRTAAHLDSGDYSEGFSNLSVLTNGKNYSGGYLVFPEYSVAVNIRPGDLLLVNNHECIHGNTEIILEEEGAERYSIVCYARDNMDQLGSFEYEQYRKKFVYERSLNKDHPCTNGKWNGVSAGMFGSKEWDDFLEQNPNGKKWKELYESN